MNANGKAPEGLPALRDERGRVLPGSRLGVGNLGQHHRGELRRALITAKTPEDIRRVGAKLVEEALAGNVYAAKVWLDHGPGPSLAGRGNQRAGWRTTGLGPDRHHDHGGVGERPSRPG